jgi:hypothetical protein
MPRIIVTTQPSRIPDDAEVLLDEDVQSVHVSTRHAAAQLVERLSWAIRDAEEVERSHRLRRNAIGGRGLESSRDAEVRVAVGV